MAPYFASELWAGFQSAPNRINLDCKDFDWDKSVLEQSWPQIDWDYQLELVCQVYNYYRHNKTILLCPVVASYYDLNMKYVIN